MWSTDGKAEFAAEATCTVNSDEDAVSLGDDLAGQIQTKAREADRPDVLEAVAIIG